MGLGKKLRLLLFIILGGIIFYFWGENIFKGLKEAGEIVDLVLKKFLIIPGDKIFLWLGNRVNELSNDLRSNFDFLGLISFLFLLVIFVCYLIIWFLIRCFFAFFSLFITELINYCIEVFRGDSFGGKIFLSFILSCISGGLFNFLMLPLFCQVVKPIYALTIVDFFNLLKRGEKKKLKLPIYLSLAILMFCWGSWRLFVAPFLNNLDEIKERLQHFKISTTTQWEAHEESFWELMEGRKN